MGDALGKTVYNNAVYNSAYMPFYVPELDFLRRRFYSYSTNPDKAREIFLPEGYQFGGVETFYSHLKVYKCRLYMFIIHDSGVHKLASFRESFVTACELPYPLPYPYPYEFTLYPNPGDGLFNVSIPDGVIGPFVVKVFNNVGKLVLDTTLDEQSKAIDLRVFGKGLFTVQINNSKPIRVAIK